MKRTLFIALSICIGYNSMAQNPTSTVKLAKGQKITSSITTNTEMDMGMGGNVTASTFNENVLNVTATIGDSYTVTNTLTKLKTSIDAMIQKIDFDSENPADMSSEKGKTMGGKLNQPVTVKLDAAGNATIDSPEKPKEEAAQMDPTSGIMSMMGGGTDEGVVEGAFILIPAGKKVGDTWADSTIEKKLQVRRSYTLKSLAGNDATITMTMNSDMNMAMDAQGMELEMNMTSKGTGEIIADISTGLAKKKTINADINGDMQIAGQSLPISGKTTVVAVYQ